MSEYVKFTHERAASSLVGFPTLAELNAYRRRLLELRLIGVDSNGVSFGNLSVREGATKNFYITGSRTGALPELALSECARVVDYDFKSNCVRYEGTAIPSSESLTHAAIYEADKKAAAVIHCHDSSLWAALLNRAPTTSGAVDYGTPAMADEVMRLFEVTNVQSRKLLVMAGHDGGLVTFGRDLQEAFSVLMRERNE